MKNNIDTTFMVISPLLLILGVLGLFFSGTMFAGYVLFLFGCATGLMGVAISTGFDSYERFHLLVSLLGFGLMGLFVFTGILEKIIIAALVLYVVDFVLMVISIKKEVPSEKTEDYSKEYSKFNETKLYDELENIKEEFNHVKILEEGNAEDIEDLSAKEEASRIKNELSQAVVLQDPKEGRYFYKETGTLFHVKDCIALQRMNKKELKSSNSRTSLLAKGYKSCKICNS